MSISLIIFAGMSWGAEQKSKFPTKEQWASEILKSLLHEDPVTTPTKRSFKSEILNWEPLAALPPEAGRVGAFVGISGDALIVAGGEFDPWLSHKSSHANADAIYILESPAGTWKKVGSLPSPMTGGVSFSTSKGLVCAGGCSKSGLVADVTLLSWDGHRLAQKPLPSLPTAYFYSSGAVLKDTLYFISGTIRTDDKKAMWIFWVLDLNRLERGWQELEPCPGSFRSESMMAVQGGSIFIFGGYTYPAPNRPINFGNEKKAFYDTWRYTPGKGWSRVADMPHPRVSETFTGPRGFPFFETVRSFTPYYSTSSAVPCGQSHFLAMGRWSDTGSGILAYHAITNTWTKLGNTPGGFTNASLLPWRGGFAAVCPSDGSVWHATPVSRKADFGFLNYATLVLYLLGMVGIGWACMRLNRNTEDFFRGSQKIPWWAAGLSIFATMLSSITFMAIPAKAYATDWVFMLANLPILLLCPIVIRLYLPFYRRLDATSAYEYLEKRFNLPVRLFGAAAFVLYHVGRVAVVLYLPAIALATVTSLNVSACIAIMGVLSVLYCVMGGIQAVIWTDVAQTVVLLGGALFSLALILWRVFDPADGFGPLFAMANEAGKFHMADWSWDATTATIWVVLLGNLFSNLAPFTADQAVVQRYMTTPDEKAAARAIWINGIMTIPTTVLFFAVGTALFLFYKLNPERLDPTLQTDAIFPLFISRELPPGVAGLVVAGIFAAAQSTIAASIHSSSTVIVTDFVRRLRRRGPAAGGDLGLARGLTGVLGVFGTGLALMLADAGVKSLWDIFLQLLGLVGGSLAGLFVLGIFTRRANGPGALIGAISGAVALCLVQRHTPIHFFLYAAIGILTCCAVGYAASLFFGGAGKPLDGLTIYTLNERTRPQSEPEPLPAKSEI